MSAHNARNAMPRAAKQSHGSVMIPFTGSPAHPMVCKSRASDWNGGAATQLSTLIRQRHLIGSSLNPTRRLQDPSRGRRAAALDDLAPHRRRGPSAVLANSVEGFSEEMGQVNLNW